MWLFTFDWESIWWESYLWKNIQQRLRPLREEKLRIVQDRLWIDTISRPNSETCDISDTNSILRFLARENLDCAFNCEPDTSPSRALELCNIILWTIPSGKYIHIIPHENTETAAREKRWSDMFWYFEVWIRDFPQKEIELQNSLTRFKIFFHQTIWSSPQ
jgi:hypothetical protein